MSEATFDLARAHRRFAVELNNLAWDLLETPNRTPADDERMIHAAHAACFHWLEVGGPLNHLRAECLLATAYASVGLGEAALRHAERCMALSNEAGDTQTTFDRATAHGCASLAYASVGRMAEANSQHDLAKAAAEQFDDPSEGMVFARWYPAPSAP